MWTARCHFCLQVMRLGAPVTALTLSPAMDMLATAHASARGIYLWSNQLLFGGASDVLPSQVLEMPRASLILIEMLFSNL